VPNIRFGDRPSIPERNCIAKKNSGWGVSISLRVIQLQEKNDFSSAVFERVEGNILCLKFDLEAGRQSYREIELQKIFQSRA
jgi:hypothetical protein